MSCLHHHPILSPPQYGEYCPESASTRNGGYWRLPGRNLLNTGKENFYIHLLATLMTKKDNVIIKMFLLF